MEKRWFVVSREYERGWGSSEISVAEYPTESVANAVAAKYNAELPDVFPAPDYYIMASVSCDLNHLYSKNYVDCRTEAKHG